MFLRKKIVLSIVFVFCAMGCTSTDPEARQKELQESQKKHPYNRPWDGYEPFLQDKKWGFKDEFGRIALPPIYEDIYIPTGESFHEYLIVKKDDKWGVISTTGEQVIPYRFEEIRFNYQNYNALFDTRFSVKENDQWGLIDLQGKFLLKPLYDSISNTTVNYNIVKVRKANKYGYLNFRTGQETIPVIFDSVWFSGSNFVLFCSDEKYGYYDYLKREKVIPALYDEIVSLYKYVTVRIGENYGLIDWDGKTIVPIKYKALRQYYINEYLFAQVKINDKWGIIDSKGREVFPILYDSILYPRRHDDEAVKVMNNHRWGFVNKSGKEIIPLIYEEIDSHFFEKLMMVKKDGKWGVINKEAQLIIPIKYEAVHYYEHNGIKIPETPPTKVKLDGKWGFIDSTGKEATEIKYEDIGHPKGRMIPVKFDHKWGFINSKGVTISSIIYDTIIPFGYSYVGNRNGKWGIIDTKGKELTSFNYEEIYQYDSFLIIFKRNDRWELLDYYSGKTLVYFKEQYEDIGVFTTDLTAVMKDEKWGFINSTGKVIVPFKFDAITNDWTDGKIGVSIDGKWGVMNNKGVLVEPIKADYDKMAVDAY